MTDRELLQAIVDAWVRLGKCEDEFEDDRTACAEYQEHLDTAIYRALYVVYPERAPQIST